MSDSRLQHLQDVEGKYKGIREASSHKSLPLINVCPCISALISVTALKNNMYTK